jgi:hypothetical protein
MTLIGTCSEYLRNSLGKRGLAHPWKTAHHHQHRASLPE